MTGHSDSIRSVAVTPDGQCAVSASDDHTLKVWNLENGK
jgi:WD40 repeat protein